MASESRANPAEGKLVPAPQKGPVFGGLGYGRNALAFLLHPAAAARKIVELGPSDRDGRLNATLVTVTWFVGTKTATGVDPPGLSRL